MTSEMWPNYPPEVSQLLLNEASPMSFDVDQTIARTDVVAVPFYNELTGESRTVEEMDETWCMVRWCQERYDCSPDEALERMKSIWNSQRVVSGARPVTGAVDLISYLHSIGINPYFVTSRPGSMRQYTIDWFGVHFPFVDSQRVLVQDSLDYDNDFKARTLGRLKPRVHFDDMLDHALRIAEAGTLVIVVNNQANRQVISHERVKRPLAVVSHTDVNIRHSFEVLVRHLQQMSHNSG